MAQKPVHFQFAYFFQKLNNFYFLFCLNISLGTEVIHKKLGFYWMFLRAPTASHQRQMGANVHICLVLPSMTCVFTDLCIH